jgi:glycosyltransferase involved in cell wall biosynthesis
MPGMAADLPPIDVLLATHNGADFLDAQVHSLLEQSQQGFRLLVRDDASTDGTAALLEEWSARCPGKIELIDGGGRRLGACGNFAALLARSAADYVMFCDQDDVWHPEKIARTLGRMTAAERETGADRPLLVHSDLAVVDKSLRPLGNSCWRYQHLDVRRGATLNRLLMQNVVTGCATMANRALVRKAVPIPPEAVLHDWWLALVAAAFGRIECLDEPTVRYRQHACNQVGAVRWDLPHMARKASRLFDHGYLVEALAASGRQARAFLERFGPELSVPQRRAVAAFVGLGQCGFLGRRWRVARYGFYRSGLLRNLGLFARM